VGKKQQGHRNQKDTKDISQTKKDALKPRSASREAKRQKKKDSRKRGGKNPYP